jgi:hypothetical protein
MRTNNGKSNRADRAEYEKKNFKYQNVCFKLSEIEEIETYCRENGVAKNTLIREAVMKAIGK